MRVLALALALAALPTIARADQCALNNGAIAEAAAKLVTPGSRVLEFCEPCGDRAPGKPFEVKKVAVRNGELLVNGNAVDLAYLFVEASKTEFKNVGVATACGASRVSAWIRDGKPGGVVSTARHAPPRPPSSMPSLPRATSPTDLVGTWTVKLTTWMSSCPAKSSGPDETWWIDVQSGKVSISTSGTLAFEGAASSLTHGSFQHSLQARQAASGAVLKLSHSFRDKLWGTIIVGSPTGNPSDPVCVTQFNISGNRQP
jgi:hypothetical protein